MNPHIRISVRGLIIEKESRLEEIEKAHYTEEVYSDKNRYRELEEESHALKKELEDLYREWNTWA